MATPCRSPPDIVPTVVSGVIAEVNPICSTMSRRVSSRIRRMSSSPKRAVISRPMKMFRHSTCLSASAFSW